MFIIKSFKSKELIQNGNSTNLRYDSNLDKITQRNPSEESFIDIPIINPVWINYFEGFELNPREKGIVVSLSQNGQNFEFVSALEKWKSTVEPTYYDCQYFRKIIQYWRGSLQLRIRLLNDNQKKVIGEVKIGYWIIGNHIDYLSEFGVPKHTSLEVKSHRIVPLRDTSRASIPKDIPLSKVNSVKYQDFKNQKPEKTGVFDKEKGEVVFYENISSSYIRLLFYLSIKSNFIYDFEQISETPTISVLLKEGRDYITNGIIESIRINERQDRYVSYTYFYDQPFEVGVTCQSQRDLREYTNQVVTTLNKSNPIHIPTHDFYLGFYLSEKPQYFQSVDNVTDSSLYSSLFEITFKFIPDFQETYLYDRINNVTLTFDSEEKVPLQSDTIGSYIFGSKDYTPPLGLLEVDELDHYILQNYSSNISNKVGVDGGSENRHVRVFNSPRVVNEVYLILPRYSIIIEITGIVGAIGEADHEYIKAYQNSIIYGVTTIAMQGEESDNYITNRDLVNHTYIQVRH